MSAAPAGKILFLVTEDWYFWSHRLPLARAARDAGYDVVVATRVDRHGDKIRAEDFSLRPLMLSRRSVNPLRELFSALQIVWIYWQESPDVVHHVALKPIIYGSLAARLSGIGRVVNAFAGLGYAFTAGRGGAARAAASFLLKTSFVGLGARAIVQNADDAAVLTAAGILAEEDLTIIRGSGVDTAAFRPTPEPAGAPLVVMPARLLWDKGVGEFVEAARLLKSQGVQARFALVGDRDPENPAAVAQKDIERWRASGDVEIWGRRDDMPEVLAQSHLVCLPSYREGLPKALLEAAASGRAAVATDVPGCREIVQDGRTGLLVAAQDAAALAAALRRLLEDKPLRERLALSARRLVETEFSQETIARKTLEVYARLLEGRPR